MSERLLQVESSVEVNMKKTTSRNAWMAVLAHSPVSELEQQWASMPKPRFQWIRRPEHGAVMLRGCVGRTGMIFNLGEASVTRCTLQIETGEIGIAYVLGRGKRHAALAAVFDGLMQHEQRNGGDVFSSLIDRLQRRLDEQTRETTTQTFMSKVDFFMVGQGGGSK
ncbi:phosphonate C-P lyase system protein PhnG [Burkholderia cepacia]|uniref:phosphonate C-P lyase system protein PhnG n=1 Tax=Burkholderia cepacia TaxID=292 RepID=UPI002AB601CD|nr:phosphonate C-P lyase system protein PhnG [Burkholderia cepacia]